MIQFELKGVSFTYPNCDKPALNNIDLKIKQGEFVVLCGASGCGKSTLLRQLKPVLAPHGKRLGDILYNGASIESLSSIEQTQIGFVMQDAEKQIVTDKVWHELAFGLENIGLDEQSMRLRVAEMSSFFGINSWFHKKTSELSGGQKQLLCLAAIMVMHPDAIILDEPTAQLDPIAADEFLNTLKKLNSELGLTIIVSEHRLETLFPVCDRIIAMDAGKIVSDCEPRAAAAEFTADMASFMPASVRLYSKFSSNMDNAPLTVRDGRRFLSSIVEKKLTLPIQQEVRHKKDALLYMSGVWFRYSQNEPDVLRGMDLTAYSGELFCILGGNGAGKSTALSVASGMKKPYRGYVKFKGKHIAKMKDSELYNCGITALVQNPQCLFVQPTVLDELTDMLRGKSSAEINRAVWDVAELMEITHLMKMHPYDLSGGEQQRAAIAKVLLTKPALLMLDEPTKGMDAKFKQHFAMTLKKLTQSNVGIILVSHDLEFCAEYADRCAMCFDGMLVSCGAPREILSGNTFYTTMANRIARGYIDNAITVGDIVTSCTKSF